MEFHAMPVGGAVRLNRADEPSLQGHILLFLPLVCVCFHIVWYKTARYCLLVSSASLRFMCGNKMALHFFCSVVFEALMTYFSRKRSSFM